MANDPWAFTPVADAPTPAPDQPAIQPLPGGTPGEPAPVGLVSAAPPVTPNPNAFDPVADPNAPQEYIPEAVRNSVFAKSDMAALNAMPNDQAFDDAVRLNKGDVRWPLEYFKGISPDVAAKVQQLAQDNNTTFDVAHASKDELQNIETAKNIFATLSATDANGKPAYPATEAWLKNPTNMAMAHDDVAALAQIEGAVRSRQQLGESSTFQFLRSLGSQGLSTLSGLLQFPAMMTALTAPAPGEGGESEDEARRFYAATHPGGSQPIQSAAEPGLDGSDPDAAPPVPNATLAKLEAPNAPLPKWLNTFWGAATYLSDEAKATSPVSYDGQSVVGELRQGRVGSASALGLSTVLGQAPAIGLTALQPEVGLSEMGASSGGETYGRDEEAGKPQDMAALNGVVSFLANYLGGKIIGHAAILQDAKSALAGPQSLTSLAGQIVKGGTKGAVAQAGIQGTQDVGDYATGNKSAFSNEAQNLLNAAIIGFATDASVTVPMAAVDGALNLRKTQSDIASDKDLSAAVGNSKMATRDPNALAQHITDSAIAAGQPLTIGVDGEKVATFFQGDNEGLTNFASDMGTTPEAIQNAAATGGEIALPVGPYYAKYRGKTDIDTAISQDLRFTPGGLSEAELPAETARVQGMFDAIKAELEKAKTPDTAKLPDQVATLRDTLLRSKDEGGMGYSSDEADSQIAVMMAGLENIAAQRGESVGDTINRLGLELRAGGDMAELGKEDVSIRNQGGTDSERATKREALKNQTPVPVDTTPFDGTADTKEIHSAAIAEFKKQRALGPVTTPDGRSVQFSGQGIKKSLSHIGDRRVARIVPAVRDMLAQGVHLWSESARKAEPNVRAYHSYAAKASLDGKDVYAHFRIREDSSGNFHYDHDVSSIEEIENPASATKAEPGSESAGTASHPAEPGDGLPSDKNRLRAWWHEVKLDENGVPPKFQGERGAVTFAQGKTIIHLFKSADMSTFLHETGHILFHEMQSMVEQGIANPDTVADFKTLLDFAGVKEGGKLDTAGEEKVVKAFEAYLREGKAPSVELARPFSRIRAWLTSVYRTIAALGVEPTESVRNVFDRMLASQEDIADAQEYYSRKGEVLNLIQADEKEKADLRAKLDKANTSALDKQTSAYLKSYLKAVGGMSAIREAAKEAVEGNKVYKAIETAKEGKIAESSLLSVLGKQGLADFKEQYPTLVSKKGEHTLESLAAEHDFDSPESLADNLTSAVPKAEAIKSYTRRLVTDKEQELRDEITKRGMTPADGAMHTNASLSYLIAETQLMARKLQGKGAPRIRLDERVYRDAAREAVGNMSVKRAVRFDLFAKAEARLARQVLDFAKKGDWEEALKARQKQMAQHAMVQEAIAARDERAAIERRYSKTKLDSAIARTARDFRDPVRQILSSYGLSDVKPSAPYDLTQLNGVDAALFAQIPTWIVQGQNSGADYRNLKFSELQDIDSAARTVLSFGSDEMKSLKAGEEKTVAEWVSKSAGLMDKLKDKKVAQQGQAFAYPMLKFADWMKNHGMMTQFLAKIADHFSDTGPFSRLYQRMTGAEAEETKHGQTVLHNLEGPQKTLAGAMARIAKEYGSAHFDIPGLPLPDAMRKAGRGRWTPEMLVSFMMNTGNEGNMTALRNAYGYSPDQIAKIASHFTRDELKAVQKTWDVVDSLYEPLAKTSRDVYDRDVAKVEAQRQTWQSKDGDVVDLEGGYYPLVFDHEINDAAGRIQEDDIMKGQTAAVFRSAKPEDGMTQSRVVGHSLPPYLTLGVLGSHLSDTLHFIHYAAVMRDFNRVTSDSAWKSKFTDKFGNGMYKVLRDWVKYQAVPRRHPTSEVMRGPDKVMDWTRAATTTAILGWKLPTAMLWRTSAFNSAVELGGWKWMGEGYKFLGTKGLGTSVLGTTNTEGWKQIIAKSDFMRNNENTFDREVKDAIEQMRGPSKEFSIPGTSVKFTWNDVKHMAFVWTQMNDRAIKAPAWAGGYVKYLTTMADSSKTDEENEREAIAYADRVIQNSQPSALRAEQSSAQRAEGWLRFTTMFMTWGFKYGNRLFYNNRAWNEGAISNKQYISHIVQEVMLEPWARLALYSALAGTMPEWYQWPLANMENLLQWMPVMNTVPRLFEGRDGLSADTILPMSEGLKRINSLKKDAPTFDGPMMAWDMARLTDFFLRTGLTNVAKDLVNTGSKIAGNKPLLP